jgi:hypothetical protein
VPRIPLRDHLDRPSGVRQFDEDGRTPPGHARRVGTIGEWLARGESNVKRAELWEILNRYEAGRSAMEATNFKRYADQVLAHWQAQGWHRRLWRWMRRVPAPMPPTLPAVPLEGL